MQILVTVLLSGVVATVVTAILNISIQTKTQRINRLEEFCDCIFSISKINREIFWNRVEQKMLLETEQLEELKQSRNTAGALEADYIKNLTRAHTISVMSQIDRKKLDRLDRSCTQLANLAYNYRKEDKDKPENEMLDLAAKRELIIEEIMIEVASHAKQLQDPFRIFYRS